MNFIKKITKNGVPIYILPMAGAKTVASGVLINVGSRDEKWPAEAGLAHGFEHMFFQGTKNFPDKKTLSEYIEEVGGIKNAFTSRELTFFYNQVPYPEFKRSVRLLGEQIENSLIPAEKINLEMQVIVQELKRAEDNPEIFLSNFTYQTVYKNHSLSQSPYGKKESLLNFKRNDFIGFMNRYYQPENYTFLIAGKIKPNEALREFNRHFKKKIGVNKNNVRLSENFPKKSESVAVAYKKINQVHVNLAAPILSAIIKEKISLDLFSLMIGSGSASPLFEEIRNKRGLCYQVYASYYQGIDAGLFRIYMATGKEKYKEAIDVAFSVIEKNRTNKERLNKIKKMKLGKLSLKYEDPLNVITDAAYMTAFMGRPLGYKEIEKSIKNITIEDIKKVVNKYLKFEQFTIVLVAPEDFRQ